jgi:hypothetical protein
MPLRALCKLLLADPEITPFTAPVHTMGILLPELTRSGAKRVRKRVPVEYSTVVQDGG